MTGAVNLLIDITDRKQAAIEAARLAAIVSNSDDAIISKTLDGRVTSWNAGATRIFGYEPREMIGHPIMRIVPPDLQDEEKEILARLQRGERIDHFDTVRVRKDGKRLNISLTVSPVRDSAGNVVGASKVARDVTDRKQAEELQFLLLEELNHRVKNTLATIQSIAGQTLRRSANPVDFVASFNGRIQALAQAHELLVRSEMRGASVADLVRDQVVLGGAGGTRVSSAGPYLMLDPRLTVQVGLVLHELATNARKYGALSVAAGRLSISWKMLMNTPRELLLEWKEAGVPDVRTPVSRGFGTTLIERTLEANGGEAAMRYSADGLTCSIRLPLPEEGRPNMSILAASMRQGGTSQSVQGERDVKLAGKRILLIEDEPLIAMDLETHLEAAGCRVVGPAGTIKAAHRIIAEDPFDAALLDVNLAGQQVDTLAAALTQKGIPFAFATGYGREALPAGFQDAPVLTKPFSAEQLIAVVEGLLSRASRSSSVVPLRPRSA